MTPSGTGRLMAWFTIMSRNRPVMGSDTGGRFSNDPFNAAENLLPSPHDPYSCVNIVYIHSDFPLNCQSDGKFLLLQFFNFTA